MSQEKLDRKRDEIEKVRQKREMREEKLDRKER